MSLCLFATVAHQTSLGLYERRFPFVSDSSDGEAIEEEAFTILEALGIERCNVESIAIAFVGPVHMGQHAILY